MGEGLIGEWAFLHQSRGTEMPCWTARTLPGQGKQRKMLFLSFPSAFYVPYQDVFVPRDRPAG